MHSFDNSFSQQRRSDVSVTEKQVNKTVWVAITTQPPTLNGMGNEYRPKGGEALRLESKGRYDSFHTWIYLPPTRLPH